jgi:hypothetical protein
MDLKCRGKLEIEEDPCVRSQAVLHKMHLHLRVHLDLVVQAFLTGLDQFSLRGRPPGWKEFLQVDYFGTVLHCELNAFDDVISQHVIDAA